MALTEKAQASTMFHAGSETRFVMDDSGYSEHGVILRTTMEMTDVALFLDEHHVRQIADLMIEWLNALDLKRSREQANDFGDELVR